MSKVTMARLTPRMLKMMARKMNKQILKRRMLFSWKLSQRMITTIQSKTS